MLVTASQMQQIEAAAFACGHNAADLMELAGAGIAHCIQQFFPRPGHAILYLGKGHNAGDALVAARHLSAAGWQISARCALPRETWRPLLRKHWDTLPTQITDLQNPPDLHSQPPGPIILIDGILGIGARGPLANEIQVLTREMNQLRQQHARVIALDLPTGLDCDSGHPQTDCVTADLTITIGQVKQGLVRDHAIDHVGRLALVPLAALQLPADRTSLSAPPPQFSPQLATPSRLAPLLPRRPFEFHKGQAGRLSLLAGSPEYTGAALLASAAALRAGAGLVTLWSSPATIPLLAPRLPPEIMLRPFVDPQEMLALPHDALVIGPGLGRSYDHHLKALFPAHKEPAVIDADALNFLAANPHLIPSPATRILTPHPGEWQRLHPRPIQHPQQDRHLSAADFTALHPSQTLLLKGARSLIAAQGQIRWINSSGHPGMATGGMGDLLSGVLGGLLAQGMSATNAAAIASWLCGRAAERAALASHQLAVLPSDILDHLGPALTDLTEGGF